MAISPLSSTTAPIVPLQNAPKAFQGSFANISSKVAIVQFGQTPKKATGWCTALFSLAFILSGCGKKQEVSVSPQTPVQRRYLEYSIIQPDWETKPIPLGKCLDIYDQAEAFYRQSNTKKPMSKTSKGIPEVDWIAYLMSVNQQAIESRNALAATTTEADFAHLLAGDKAKQKEVFVVKKIEELYPYAASNPNFCLTKTDITKAARFDGKPEDLSSSDIENVSGPRVKN